MADKNKNEPMIQGAMGHVNELMRGVMGEMKSYQPEKIGRRKRTKAEKDKLWRDLNGLSREDIQQIMTTMAINAGHVDGEEQPCEVCQFLADKVSEKMAERDGA